MRLLLCIFVGISFGVPLLADTQTPPATQPAAAPEVISKTPVAKDKDRTSKVPPQTLYRMLNQHLTNAQSAKAGFSEDRVAAAPDDLQLSFYSCRYRYYYHRDKTEMTETKTLIKRCQSDLDHMKSARSFYSEAKKLLDNNADIGDASIRQRVNQERSTLTGLIATLEPAVTQVRAAVLKLVSDPWKPTDPPPPARPDTVWMDFPPDTTGIQRVR